MYIINFCHFSLFADDFSFIFQVYHNVHQAVSRIAREEGIRGFYRGLTPALTQIAPQMGLQFGLYSLFTQMWDNLKGTASFKIPGKFLFLYVNDNIC